MEFPQDVEEIEFEDIMEIESRPNLTVNSIRDKSTLLQFIEESGGMDRVFPPLDGTAFYVNICKINHSCEPNVFVRYAMSSTPGIGLIAEIVALQEINPGDELLQSYIDQSKGKPLQ